ncbi:Rrf2 family transcriptional regulator [Chlorobaculum thiosulfatiphilum]|jgi:Rrf2 family protein|uniref:Rrf2 family transcriptional regulator n=1 Tax=Chlorobaculum thiosulfatiphilum TaxID=115852 RepID=A0A5C4S2W6_CHLTI|nr:Rrf2 family transcriptional regulator [Chlorobaculum thiosulfatiphilum]TNJ37482.1 Rrf2 family transcriptional regulator [Chlorobaculum thiosulfatiphilum]
MKVLNKETDYAVRALISLGMKSDGWVSAKVISGEQAIPYQFLRRILQELIRNGLVESKEGAGGGVRLAKEPGLIAVAEVIEIFQGKVQLSECMFRKQLCSNRANCVLRHEIMRIEKMVNQEFSEVTIGKLIADLKAVEAMKG